MKQYLLSAWERWKGYGGHWQKLAFFFRLNVVRFFISWFALTPIALKLLEAMPSTWPISDGTMTFHINLSLPFSWWVLWFASLCYTMAFILYQLWCPTFIKESPDFASYSAIQHSPRWLVWQIYYSWIGISERDKFAERLITKQYAKPTDDIDQAEDAKPKVEQSGTVWKFKHHDQWYEVRVSESLSMDLQRDYFWEILGRWARSHPIWRHTVWGLLSLSFLATAYVVIENIVYVLAYLCRNWPT